MAQKKKKKKRFKRLSVKVLIPLLILALILGAGIYYKDALPDPLRQVFTQIEQLLQPDGNGGDDSIIGDGTLGGQISEIPAPDEGGYLTVHYIDVGQGDSILITCDGEYMLIDAGENDKTNTVINYLDSLNITELDLVVGTHAHSDHIGEMGDVLNAIPAEEVWYPSYRHGTKTEDKFLTAAENCGAAIYQPELGETYDLGGATVTVLGPVKDDYTDPNDMSIILMVQFGENKFLFTGDMEHTDGAESDLVDYWGEDKLKADVLKVGHHGSDTSTRYYFLRAVSPSYAVISVGEGNSYGHPKQETLDILGQAEIYTYRTDYMGSIVAVSDGKAIQFGWTNADAQPYIPD